MWCAIATRSGVEARLAYMMLTSGAGARHTFHLRSTALCWPKKETTMTGFWITIVLVVLAIVGVSVLVGKTLNKPKRLSSDRQSEMTALKASGALKHRKSNRN